MFNKKYYYLFKIQYLGYRFHGWQKQPKIKTVQLMIERTLKFILEDQKFRILAAGRTDAMVSANEAAFELFLNDYSISRRINCIAIYKKIPNCLRILV